MSRGVVMTIVSIRSALSISVHAGVAVGSSWHWLEFSFITIKITHLCIDEFPVFFFTHGSDVTMAIVILIIMVNSNFNDVRPFITSYDCLQDAVEFTCE